MAESPQNPKLITVEEAARRLGIGKSTVHREVQAGRIPHIRIAKRCIRLRESDIQQLLQPEPAGCAHG